MSERVNQVSSAGISFTAFHFFFLLETLKKNMRCTMCTGSTEWRNRRLDKSKRPHAERRWVKRISSEAPCQRAVIAPFIERRRPTRARLRVFGYFVSQESTTSSRTWVHWAEAVKYAHRQNYSNGCRLLTLYKVSLQLVCISWVRSGFKRLLMRNSPLKLTLFR